MTTSHDYQSSDFLTAACLEMPGSCLNLWVDQESKDAAAALHPPDPPLHTVTTAESRAGFYLGAYNVDLGHLTLSTKFESTELSLPVARALNPVWSISCC